MAHIVLLGDSIFDNGRYVLGEPDVIAQVRKLVPAGWKALLLAVDGATTHDVPGQVRQGAGGASPLVLSVGGNGGVFGGGIFSGPAGVGSHALGAFEQALEKV